MTAKLAVHQAGMVFATTSRISKGKDGVHTDNFPSLTFILLTFSHLYGFNIRHYRFTTILYKQRVASLSVTSSDTGCTAYLRLQLDVTHTCK